MGDRPERRYDVDWVRVIGILTVFSYHIMMYFNTWSWHAKNSQTTTALEPVNHALIAWIMPIMFVIAGLATHHALKRRSTGEFLKERLLRLGVPILVGAFLLSPFQVYSERVTYGQFTGSFLQFVPHYFNGWYWITPTGNFAWMGLHLWFLVVLLLFSVVTLPFFLRARGARQSRPLWLAGPTGVLLLIPALLFLFEGALYGLRLDASQSGWPFGVYLAYYLIGYTILPTELFRKAVRMVGPLALIGVAATTIPVALIPGPTGFSATFVAWQAAKMYNSWLWIVGLLYLGDRYLNRNSGALQYWNEAVMPFYVLHQPVIVGLGFAMRAVPLPIAVKFPLLYVASFAVIMVCYHWVVRPVNFLRFLVGMKPRRPEAAAESRIA